ncbi:hypothetical protein DO97_10470 [Neosynechococcus sphagnicola sy1]|uniref:UspA domain-containing protein n=1 Tax=Neosynechococcus sphagnicola sy1 TaxID=1497020 RepID=A0A098TSR4_9CYAN|nr:universal stress protein [Neosynechococcus sphagnicola]KGF73818.1 hypothetical protein DO97_10470 [Neosynechococcus sphagnicola sy1]
MFHKILVALDHSAASQRVFNEALQLAKLLESHLLLLHIHSSEEYGYPMMWVTPSIGSSYPGVYDQLVDSYLKLRETFEQQGLELLKSQAAVAIAAGITTEFSQNTGEPGPRICDLAKNWEADLVIVGRRQQHALSEWFFGSVSNHVLHHAPCSVLAIQGQTEPQETVAQS